MYYEILVKKKDDPLYVDFKYVETVNNVEEREKARKNWGAKGYRVRTRKTRSFGPPTITYLYKK